MAKAKNKHVDPNAARRMLNRGTGRGKKAPDSKSNRPGKLKGGGVSHKKKT